MINPQVKPAPQELQDTEQMHITGRNEKETADIDSN